MEKLKFGKKNRGKIKTGKNLVNSDRSLSPDFFYLSYANC